jgi:hypothetical protein
MKFWTFFRNLLWLVPFEEEEKHDYYGELIIFVLVYPYRFFVAISIIAWILFGILYAYPLLFVWSLCFIGYILDCIYVNSPKWQNYVEQERLESIKQNKIRQEIQRQKIIEQHKDDPPKPVIKCF